MRVLKVMKVLLLNALFSLFAFFVFSLVLIVNENSLKNKIVEKQITTLNIIAEKINIEDLNKVALVGFDGAESVKIRDLLEVYRCANGFSYIYITKRIYKNNKPQFIYYITARVPEEERSIHTAKDWFMLEVVPPESNEFFINSAREVEEKGVYKGYYSNLYYDLLKTKKQLITTTIALQSPKSDTIYYLSGDYDYSKVREDMTGFKQLSTVIILAFIIYLVFISTIGYRVYTLFWEEKKND